MPTCESCNRTVENGKEMKHWICEDCRVERQQEQEQEINTDQQK